MKILVTGAHFTPAQAVIEELQKFPGLKIVYVGRKTTIEGDKTPSVESQVLPKLGVKFIPITTGRLRRFLSFATLTSLLKIPVGFIQAPFILLSEKPDLSLSFGGYVGLPLVIWSWLLSIPVIAHEQTLVSGLANSISNLFAKKIAVSFDKDYGFDKSKVILTGNPLRKELLETKSKPSKEVSELFKIAKKEKAKVILITGGNQGSHAINLAVSENLEELTDLAFIIHQTGDSKFKDFENLLQQKNTLKNPQKYLVKKWIDVEDLAGIFRNVDLVISRAGANTLTELAYFGIPAILVPIPFLYKDEQRVNAKFFKEKGLCEVIEQKDLNGKKLAAQIREMFNLYKKHKTIAKKARQLVIPDAGKRLAQLVLVSAHKNA